MTNDTLFFDTDCLSAFLWVNEESILPKLYPGKIVIPQKVYEEISNPNTPHLKKRIDKLVSQKLVTIESIFIGTDEFDYYTKFTQKPDSGFKIIGDGEAACLAMAKVNNGIVASNNLRDIMQCIKIFNLKNITTGDILTHALEKGLITKEEGEEIWGLMREKRRKLGADTFDEYIKNRAK